ncbi:MAG: DUF4352 domain-containing protein [Dehalococcoidia bacterium]
MTMLRAVGLLLLSGLVAAVGIVMLVVKINSGIVNSEIDSRSYNAGIGDNAATPTGSFGSYGSDANATLTAVIGDATAFSIRTVTRATATPAASAVDVVGIREPVALNGSRYTVLQVLDPEPAGLFKPLTGNRRVAIQVRQEAVSSRETFNFTSFKIVDAAGNEYSWAITNQEPSFGTGAIAAGESHEGWLSFQLPADATLDLFEVAPIGRPSVPIVKLR